MQISILGPLTVRDDAGDPVAVAGARLRTLLSRLAVDAGRPVTTAALVAAVWGDTPPADEANALQTLVSRLRRTLGSDRVVQSPAGYRLDLGAAEVDALSFTELTAAAAEARRGHRAADAVALLDDALALWRGEALADVRAASPELAADAERWDALRTTALLDRAEAALSLGAGVAAVDADEVGRLAREHPLDERAAALHLRALAAAGRIAEALRAYETLRSTLADELGVDPSAELRELHLELLRDEQPTAARSARRTNLKAQLTSFVGREDEVSRIGKLLETSRLVTLVGPGGAGKTRLAAEAAAGIADLAPDGVWLVELATVTAGTDVPAAVLASLGLREVHLLDRRNVDTRDAMERLRANLADRNLVILLDNCEHVVDAAARCAELLLGDCPELRMVATSREPLGILGETLLAVPPLGTPAATAGVTEALAYPAVRLFADRVGAALPDWRLTEADVPAVVEIVTRLDGLPLAIELAAARLRTMPLADIASRLGDRFRLLTGGSRTALPRHRTLRAVVEWSWGLLTDTERAVAERLAVFPSGVTTESAGAVCGDLLDPRDVPDVLASLVDKSLLQTVAGGARLRMLETIREYGAEQLGERGELEAARRRHADHFAAVLAEAEPHLTTSGQLPWFALLRAERENIVAALRFRAETGDADGALRIAAALGVSAMMLGEHPDIAGWTAEALAVPGATDEPTRLLVRCLHAINAAATGLHVGTESLPAMVEELRDVPFPTDTLAAMLRPAMAYFGGNAELGEVWARQNLEQGSEWSRAATRMFIASFAENSGDLDTMREHTAIALEEFRRLGERWGLASTLRNLAQLLTYDGDLDGAAAAYEEALSLMREMDSTEDEIFLYQRLTDLALRRGDMATAVRWNDRARSAVVSGQTSMESALAAVMRADIEWRLGHHELGRELVEQALARVRETPSVHPGWSHASAWVLTLAARVLHEAGEPVAAVAHAKDAFAAAQVTRDFQIVAVTGVLAAELTQPHDPRSAALLLGAAARLRGTPDWSEQVISTVWRAAVAGVGEAAATAAYDEGRALPPQEALALVERTVAGLQDRLR